MDKSQAEIVRNGDLVTVVSFMGKPVQYWRELQARAASMDAVEMVEEIARLRGIVNFLLVGDK